MSEPPQNPQIRDGKGQAPDPQPPAPDGPDRTPERPPPYQGIYGAGPGQAPPGPAAGSGPPRPGYGPPGHPPPGAGGPQDHLAGRWARLGAALLDSLVLGVASVPAILFSIRWDALRESMSSGEPVTDPMDLYHIPRLIGAYVVVFLLGFAYFTVAHAKWGQTIGKKALGIRVVSVADHSALTWRQAIGRQAFVYAVSVATALLNLVPGGALIGVLGMLDNAWILWDGQKQAVHDKVAGTLVLKAPPWAPNPYARS
ncbi:MAG: RDD family protein [Actinomadura sp.]